jgi:hypothetical protein
MTRETAMAAAMKAAGVDQDIVELRLVLAKIINHERISEGICHREVSAAYSKSRQAIGIAPEGQANVASPRPEMPGAATEALSTDSVVIAAPRHHESEAATHRVSQDHAEPADLRPPGDEAGQTRRADPAQSDMPASSPASELPGEAGKAPPEGQAAYASARQPNDGAGQSRRADTVQAGLPASSPPKRLVPYAGKEPNALARKVMGSVGKKLAKVTVGYRVRDGRYLSDVKRGELRRLAQENRDEATVLQTIITILDMRHPGGDTGKTVGELIEAEDLARAVARAQDIEHGGVSTHA